MTNRLKEIRDLLLSKFEFRTNELMQEVEVRPHGGSAWEKAKLPNLWYHINEHIDQGVSIEFIEQLIKSEQIAPLCNPFKQWIQTLPKPPRSKKDIFEHVTSLLRLTRNAQKERERLALALKNWFVSAIRCLYEEVPPKHCFVLIGAPGIGKTPFLKSFLPPHLQNLLLDFPCTNQKEALTEALVLFIEEVGAWLNDNTANFRNLIEAKKVGSRSRARLASFLGTANNGKFLKTANSTKIICFEIEKIRNRQAAEEQKQEYKQKGQTAYKHAIAEDLDISIAWSTAYKLYKEGYCPDYTPKQLEEIKRKNMLYATAAGNLEIIYRFFEPADQITGKLFTPTQIAKDLNTLQTEVKFSPTAVGMALQSDNIKKIYGANAHGYYLTRLTTEEDEPKEENGEKPENTPKKRGRKPRKSAE